jgi:MoaA/NifB/PqqE/SkfB family radical SAM enzyme
MGRLAMVVNSGEHQYEDITTLWNDAHAHLKPSLEATESSIINLHSCPCCNEKKAVEVVTDLRPGTQSWWLQAVVLYCTACEHVFSSNIAKQQYLSSLAPDIDAKTLSITHPITEVNARLWVRFPDFLNIEPTTRCNFECWYCVGRMMEQGDIDEKNFIKMLENYPELKVLALVGEGEPFLHKGFFNMSKLAIDKGIKIATTSNGSTLSTSLVKKICETGIHYVSISIDSVNPEQFVATRIKGDLEKVLNGIRRLKQFRDDNGYQYPKIGLKGTLFDYSKDQLPEISKKAISCGVDVLEGFQPLNRKQSYIKIYPHEHFHQLEAIDDVVKNINESISEVLESDDYSIMSLQEFSQQEEMNLLDCGRNNGLRKNCDERWLYSLFSGDVTPCCQIKESFSENWNLFNNPVKQIMSDPEYENVRFNLWNGFFLAQCKGCYKT